MRKQNDYRIKPVFIMIITVIQAAFLWGCSQTFDKDRWQEKPDERKGMVYGMLDKHELTGKTEEEVIALLGEPESEEDAPERQLVYYLGRAGLGVDDSLLRLYVDASGKVESYRVTND